MLFGGVRGVCGSVVVGVGVSLVGLCVVVVFVCVLWFLLCLVGGGCGVGVWGAWVVLVVCM